MAIWSDPIFCNDINKVASLDIPWDMLKNKSILISGATGLVGSFLVDVIMQRNIVYDMQCCIYALGRNEKRSQIRFNRFWNNPYFNFIQCDVNTALNIKCIDKVDYAIHLASNTHPLAYATDPIGTIITNIIGTKNMLDFSFTHAIKRFAFASSNEIYGENRGDVEKFSEEYCGYIDCNTMRAGYPESKRCGEALCQAYIKQKNMDIVIPRLTRSYGPTMIMNDSKVISQFIRKAIAGEDIVLKSDGHQYYSFTYVADAVSGLLMVLLKGKCGEAYNIADEKSDIMLKNLAKIIANKCGSNVVFDLPDAIEREGYSKATKARLDSNKLNKLGWNALYSIDEGIDNTINILKNYITMRNKYDT